MMGSEGADNYYRGIIGGVDQDRDFVQQGGGGGFAWVLQEGNPELKPETADTWSAGFVMSSPSENPWLAGITMVVDWYSIEIEDAIMTYSLDYANYRCFGTGLEAGLSPAEQALTLGCQLVPRDQYNGVPLSTKVSYDNQATMKSSGIDIGFTWHADIAALGWDVPGSLGFNVQANILDTYETRLSPAVYDVPIEWKGSMGPNLPGTQGGAYDYRLFTNFSYNQPNWGVTLRWRHLPSVWSAGYAEQQALIANNAAVTAGGDGIILTYTPTTEIETDSYDIFDLSGTWDINETFSVRFGITNLFDTEPVNFASTAGRPAGSDLDVCNGAPGCTNPSSYSLGSLGGFMGGYYDTLGRRFFVGVKARL
jgi:outer membrane receptor protein involved in Fe transport